MVWTVERRSAYTSRAYCAERTDQRLYLPGEIPEYWTFAPINACRRTRSGRFRGLMVLCDQLIFHDGVTLTVFGLRCLLDVGRIQEMTTYVIVGHGSFNQELTQYPPVVLVPPNTTLKFYAEAGEALFLPVDDDNDTDYVDEVAPAWQQLKERTEPVPEQGVVYNLSLVPDDSEEEHEAAENADWQGAEVIHLESGRIWLCEDAETCPTPELNVLKKTQDVAADRWEHHCKGILGTYGGNGNELTGSPAHPSEFKRHDLPPLLTADRGGPGLGGGTGLAA